MNGSVNDTEKVDTETEIVPGESGGLDDAVGDRPQHVQTAVRAMADSEADSQPPPADSASAPAASAGALPPPIPGW
ncbi:hypothetical protein EVAR_77462_1 [Eumeta japonica]|uniref:Uncharacterized protein n=1 Tax=Eumeta variegata TaxID=151549 RepID=A0A4C1ZYE5_EUMVA|nr:hypothetical protein EVAR_77462_1 [Eumeta japonica]